MFNSYVDSLGLYLHNRNLVSAHMFNGIQNVIVELFRRTPKNSSFAVKVTGHRFARDDISHNHISVQITEGNKGQIRTFTTPYVVINNVSLRLRSLVRHIPLTTSCLNRLMQGINLTVFDASFVRFDMDTGSSIINVPSSPDSRNVAFVTRNLNSRSNQNIGMTVTSL